MKIGTPSPGEEDKPKEDVLFEASLADFLKISDTQARRQLVKSGNTTADERRPPTPEELERFKAHDEFTLAKEKRVIAKRVLNWASWAFIWIASGFILLSWFYVLILFFGPNTWLEEHQAIHEIMKTGWTVTITVVALRFNSIIFDDRQNKDK